MEVLDLSHRGLVFLDFGGQKPIKQILFVVVSIQPPFFSAQKTDQTGTFWGRGNDLTLLGLVFLPREFLVVQLLTVRRASTS